MKTNQYDAIASQYHADTEKAFSAEGSEKLLNEIVFRPHITEARNWDVLDVGCGSGIHIACFADRFPELRSISGIDASKDMITLAQNKNTFPKAVFMQGDMDALPFENDAFDYIFSRNAIHYSNDVNRTLSEIARVLKKGGIFYFQVNHPVYGLFVKPSNEYLKKEEVDFSVEGGTLRVTHPTFTVGEYINALIKTGLTLLEVGEYCGNASQINQFKVPTVLSFLLTK
jgi:ubiquinone/menaquinone biosynthesis C-methylase UbiE